MQENDKPRTPLDISALPEDQTRRNSPAGPENWKSVASTLAILIAAPIIAVLLITFVFRSYEVDGPSMERTLFDNDRLIVVKVGKTWASIRGDDYIPERGEIIVFTKSGTLDPRAGGERQLIKRVTGVPGDRVVYENNRVTVYNAENPSGFNPDVVGGYEDTLGSLGGSNKTNVLVEPGEVFVMGDNRSQSSDSREFGTVPSEAIVGHLAVRFFPFDTITTF